MDETIQVPLFISNDDVFKYICPHCDIKFTSNNGMNHHTKCKHASLAGNYLSSKWQQQLRNSRNNGEIEEKTQLAE